MKLSHNKINKLSPNGTLIMDPNDIAINEINDDVGILALHDDIGSVSSISCVGYKEYPVFKSKSGMIQYEMETISQKLIDKMNDPVDELGKFIQTLSVDISQNTVNKQRQNWQNLLCENWYLSKQTKTLIPLIRFLYQILSPPDFNHILPFKSVDISQTNNINDLNLVFIAINLYHFLYFVYFLILAL